MYLRIEGQGGVKGGQRTMQNNNCCDLLRVQKQVCNVTICSFLFVCNSVRTTLLCVLIFRLTAPIVAMQICQEARLVKFIYFNK